MPMPIEKELISSDAIRRHALSADRSSSSALADASRLGMRTAFTRPEPVTNRPHAPSMAAPSRSTLLTQIHKVLKKHYQPVTPDANRPVLEHVIRGLLLENSPYAVADTVFTSLQESYFDWNEVRVAAVTDLTEQLQKLPDPAVTAA